MYHRRARSPRLKTLFATAFFTLIFLIPGTTDSQAQSRPKDPLAGVAAREARSSELMTADITPAKPSRERRVPFKQMQEDFEQLQLANNRLSEMASSDDALDHEQLGKDAAEIKMRATRLKKNLLLPEPAEGEKQKDKGKEFAARSLKLMISDLNALINSFVQNPVFQQPNIVNTEGWVRARKDLEGVIMLSEQLQKNSPRRD